MSLEIHAYEKEKGIFNVKLSGNLDTTTYQSLEKELEKVYKNSPEVIVLDLKELQFISSMGLRVIAKAKKIMKEFNGHVAIVNVKPHIMEVFDIVKALPSDQIFKDMKELDDYLIARQKIVKEGT